MILRDRFCCQGGAAMGYHRAGWDVVGVDHLPQPCYPFEFIQGDALEFLHGHGHDFDAIHASPPCQRFSSASRCRSSREKHPDLLTPTLGLLEKCGRPWIVENVPLAPMAPHHRITLCGLMFGLKVFRHRLFASNICLLQPPHQSHRGRRIGEDGMVCLAGHGGSSRKIDETHRCKAAWASAVKIDWMTRDGLAQSIPPDYTEFCGRQLMQFSPLKME